MSGVFSTTHLGILKRIINFVWVMEKKKKEVVEKYLGRTIMILSLKDESDAYAYRTGVVESIDDIGQLHGTWGSLAVIPDVDEFVVMD